MSNVTVTLSDTGRIVARSPYSPEASSLAKRVPGARWDKDNKVWTYPQSLVTCRKLREVYGQRLLVSNDLAAWAREAIARENAVVSVGTASDAELVYLATYAPRLAEALRPYQRVGAAFVRAAGDFGQGVLLADQPRTGKTLQSIAGVLDRGPKAHGLHLVVAPRLSVRNVWEREISRWTDNAVFAAFGTRQEREAAIAAALASDAPIRWLVVNHHMLQYKETCRDPFCAGVGKVGHVKAHGVDVKMEYPGLFEQEFASVIVDESHKMFGSLRVNKGNMAGMGLKKIRLAEHGIRIAVTGTPFGRGGRVQGMFGTLHWLRPTEYTSFWRWAENYLDVSEGRFGMEVGGLKKGLSEEQFYASIGTVILRRTRAEVMPWLGGKVYEDVYCEMTPKQATQYRKMEKNAAVDGLTADGVLAELTRLKQFANCRHDIIDGQPVPTADSGKITALLERLDEHGVLGGISGEKHLVLTQFEGFSRVIVDVLRDKGLKVVTITGPTSEKGRTEAINSIQHGDADICVLTTQTGGVSITLDAAQAVHMMDEMWNPEDNEQAEDRAITTTQDGNASAISVYYYRSEGTVEEAVRATVADKASQQHAVLDGRRGLEYVRKIKGNK